MHRFGVELRSGGSDEFRVSNDDLSLDPLWRASNINNISYHHCIVASPPGIFNYLIHCIMIINSTLEINHCWVLWSGYEFSRSATCSIPSSNFRIFREEETSLRAFLAGIREWTFVRVGSPSSLIDRIFWIVTLPPCSL